MELQASVLGEKILSIFKKIEVRVGSGVLYGYIVTQWHTSENRLKEIRTGLDYLLHNDFILEKDADFFVLTEAGFNEMNH